MPELRRNKLTGEWVAIAEERAKRPSSFKGIGLDDSNGACPFCRGNERLTSPDIIRMDGGKIRIIANKYPVLTADSPLGFGLHDVVIDTDIHDERLHEFDTEHLKAVLIAIRERLRDLQKDERIKYIQVFKNQGMMAGASQPHSHWQMIALPVIPLMQKNIYENARKITENTGKCYICDEIVSRGNCANLIENDTFKAYCDLASKFSHEIHITPKAHAARFLSLNDRALYDFADILKRCLAALNALFPDVSYNICFMDAFVNMPEQDYLLPSIHFYAQILPRIGALAGFEFSTNSYINAVPPEKAAQRIKEKLIF